MTQRSAAKKLTPKGAGRRDEILRKATAEFARRGYHATTITDILDGLSIARGTFYQYFANKRAIFEEILSNLLARFAGSIRPIDIDHPTASPRRQLHDNIVRVLNLVLEDRAMAKIVVAGATGMDPEFDLKVDQFTEAVRAAIIRSLSKGIEMGLVQPVDTELTATLVFGSGKELVRALADQSPDAQNVDEIAEAYIDLFARGLFTPALRDALDDDVESILHTSSGRNPVE
ncbi:MAG: TetR/AcrR family transcriptional regulator [Deltaproteobacteria bacterium]|nr:TetR/AcrR family transcriptional regulator [bacterium]MCB9476871.1 TetR/AcrR family transcriptional regulator [Deltaproteobacteria bacterium]MCB9489550.1 TetR/AcrR family transcriptional regulator [Deltaproteobacteria bacterium]